MTQTKQLIAKTLDLKEDDVLTAKEAAAMLGIQHRSVLKAISRNRLKAGQVGGMWYTTKENVKQYDNTRGRRKNNDRHHNYHGQRQAD